MNAPEEGWGVIPLVSRRWHYFGQDGRSLCGKILRLKCPLESGNDDSVDNCAECKRRRAASQRKAA